MFSGKIKYLFLALLIPLLSICSYYGTKELQSKPKAQVIVSSSGKEYYTGLIIPKNFKPKNIRSALKDLKDKGLALPEAYDLKTKFNLANAEDQGNCGSCWDYSIIGVFKDVLKINGITRSPSSQYILDCNTQGYSCDGGFFEPHELHIAPGGAVNDSDYPYTAQKGTCQTGKRKFEKILSWSYTPGGENPSVSEIKAAIFQYGTVAVGVAADQAMSNYTGGKFNGSGATELNHAVNLVGWTADGYWLMKNSWGSAWGENGGYMTIKYGTTASNSANGIGAWANYVVYNTSPDPTPTPTPDPTPTPCYPMPYTSTGHPSHIQIWRGQTIYLGTNFVKGTTYLWKAVPDFNGGAVPREARIKYTPSITKKLTMFATNKCGTAQATTTVIVNGFRGDAIPDLELELEKKN